MPYLRAYAPTDAPTDPTTHYDGSSMTVGLEFYVGTTSTGLWVSHIWIWVNADQVGTTPRVGALYRVSDQAKVAGDFTFPTMVSGWNNVQLPTPYALTVGTHYKAVVYSSSGRYSASTNYWTADVVNGAATFPSTTNATGGGQNTFNAGGTGGNQLQVYPTDTYNANSYWVDVSIWDGRDATVYAVPATATAATPVPLPEIKPDSGVYLGSTIPFPVPFFITPGSGPAAASAVAPTPTLSGVHANYSVTVPAARATAAGVVPTRPVAPRRDLNILDATTPTNYLTTPAPATQGATYAEDVWSYLDTPAAALGNTTGAEPDNNWQDTLPSGLWTGTEPNL